MEFNLKEELEQKGISQYKLAQETLVSQANISRICSSKREFKNLTIESAMKILKYIYSDDELIQVLKKYF